MPFVAFPFDQVPGKFKEFTDLREGQKVFVLSDGWVMIQTMGEAEGLYPDDDNLNVFYRRGTGFFSIGGSGYYLGNGYVLTAEHVVKPTKVEIKINSAFSWVVPIDKIGKTIYSVGGCPATLIWSDPQADLALLQVDPKQTPSLKAYDYKTAWTYNGQDSILKEGDVVATIVSARDKSKDKLWHHVVRYGKVVAPPELVKNTPARVFLMELEVIPGDSGSPVFAFDKGVPVIVGVVQAYVAYKDKIYAMAGRIDPVHRILLERK